MVNSSTAVGALILVPIFIAGSAAFVAIKTTEAYKLSFGKFSKAWASWSQYIPGRESHRRRQEKKRRCKLSSSETYGDSWPDLESTYSKQAASTFIGQSPLRDPSKEDTSSELWHPTREARLSWSFINPRSRSPDHLILSSVVRPLPVAQLPERIPLEDASIPLPLTRAREARR